MSPRSILHSHIHTLLFLCVRTHFVSPSNKADRCRTAIIPTDMNGKCAKRLRMNTKLLLVYTTLIYCGARASPREHELYDYLMANYDTRVRPVANISEPVDEG
jgi:hypothetical protein